MAVTKVQASAMAGGIVVNDKVVVKAQQTAIANTAVEDDNTTNIADLPTKVNAILVALKAHGLVAS